MAYSLMKLYTQLLKNNHLMRALSFFPLSEILMQQYSNFLDENMGA